MGMSGARGGTGNNNPFFSFFSFFGFPGCEIARVSKPETGGFNRSREAGLAASLGVVREGLGPSLLCLGMWLPVTPPWVWRCHPEHGEDKALLGPEILPAALGENSHQLSGTLGSVFISVISNTSFIIS